MASKLALVIEEEYCWGCKTCEVACKQENSSPDGIKLITIWEDGPRMMDNKLNVVFRARVCRHCDDPACLMACPEGAIIKRADGIVVLDQSVCSGCQTCQEVCPYEAIDFDPEKSVASKCNLCYHRVDQGLLPACADNVCLGHCILFGEPETIAQMKPGIRHMLTD